MKIILPKLSFLFLYRAVCFLFTSIFFADIFFLSGSYIFLDAGFGKQFKFFTLWSFLANFFVFSILFLRMIGFRIKIPDPLVAISTMMGIFTIILYWGLFFIDPNLVNYTDQCNYTVQRLNLFREYYLHLIGPLLLILEGFLFTRAFKNFLNITLCAAVINFGYFSWIELVVARFNECPKGTITNGLPYPFMNEMVISERLIFMTSCFIFGILFIWLFTKIQKIIPFMRLEK